MGERILVNDDVNAIDLERALKELSPERREYALRYRHERDRRLSVAAYLLLKDALKSEYGITENPRIERGKNGKPYLPNFPAIHFNFSHCAKVAACIVADYPVGIDVEEITAIDWAVAERVLSAAEMAAVKAAKEPLVKFAYFWTRKEAFVKLTGEGIDETRLKHIVENSLAETIAQLTTTVNPSKGYVLTTARYNIKNDIIRL